MCTTQQLRTIRTYSNCNQESIANHMHVPVDFIEKLEDGRDTLSCDQKLYISAIREILIARDDTEDLDNFYGLLKHFKIHTEWFHI